jgi:hypothetical protein
MNSFSLTCALSAVFSLLLASPALGQIEPLSITNAPGSAIVLTNASDSRPGYQWYKNGFAVKESAHLEGAESPVLVIRNCFDEDEGSYVLTAADDPLDVLASYVVKVQTFTGSFTFPPGGTIVLTGGRGGIGYLWYLNGKLVDDTWDTDRITGARTAQLIIKGAQPSDGGKYELIASAGLALLEMVTNAVYEVRVVDVPPSVPPFINNFFYIIGPDYVAFKVEAGGQRLALPVELARRGPSRSEWRHIGLHECNVHRKRWVLFRPSLERLWAGVIAPTGFAVYETGSSGHLPGHFL